ncbi:putative DNA-binding protein [Bacillus horti]|uniref:UPF0122 protein J2S11_003278 n=1 Tax=Caldalkalibacillus horti TaxID=77523 RepID=A0ABT9W272_9BACI|nr:putative DNA-binding protein [Bacillus horti]MDQ0167353.1 putative DNA-binding protein YlxM (UPF0122 family) [Bacillus horti]
MLEKTTRVNLLYDFYHGLLTEKQRLYTELYYVDDLSLSEIAEQYQVSRQAVFDNVKRVEQLLEHFEQELQLMQKHTIREDMLDELSTLLEQDRELDVHRLKNIITALKNVD